MSVIKYFEGIEHNQSNSYAQLGKKDRLQPTIFPEDWEMLTQKMMTSPGIYDVPRGGEIQIIVIDLNYQENISPSIDESTRLMGKDYSFAFIPFNRHKKIHWGKDGWFILPCPRGEIGINSNGARASKIIESMDQYINPTPAVERFSDSDKESALTKIASRNLMTSLNIDSVLSRGTNEEATKYFSQIAKLQEAGLTVSLSGLETALVAAGVEDLSEKELFALYHNLILEKQ